MRQKGDDQIGERLRNLDACAVSDALDMLGIGGAALDIKPLWPVGSVVAGSVRTIQAGPKSESAPGEHIATRSIVAADSGDIIVIANQGREDVSCWGGILSLAAVKQGIAGVVIDGACRDIAESHSLGLPLFGRAVVPVSARGRVVQVAMDVPVDIAGVSVDTGDFVIADRSGVVFVPSDAAEKVIALAERIVTREAAMSEAVNAGESVVDVMHDDRFTRVEAGAQ